MVYFFGASYRIYQSLGSKSKVGMQPNRCYGCYGSKRADPETGANPPADVLPFQVGVSDRIGRIRRGVVWGFYGCKGIHTF